MDESDNILIARYCAGDEAAFEALVRRYLQSVYHCQRGRRRARDICKSVAASGDI